MLHQGIPTATRKSRNTGVNRFDGIASKYHWHKPYITGHDTMVDLSRLIIILYELGHLQGLSRQTCSQYFTSAKLEALRLQDLLAQPIPAAWGRKGYHHPIISRALASIPQKSIKPHGIITKAWIKSGFLHTWTILEYVSIAFIFSWIFRIGEAALPQQEHNITWSMVTFSLLSTSDDMIPMTPEQLLSQPCHMVSLELHSRKKQPLARPLPGRINFARFANPSQGCTRWSDLCIATILQGWAIWNHIHELPMHELATRPLLLSPDTNRCITPSEVTAALRRHAKYLGQDPKLFTPTDLRRTQITKLAHSNIPIQLYLQTVGHKSLEASQPYLTPDVESAKQVTAQLHS